LWRRKNTNIKWFNNTLQHGNMDSRKIVLFVLKVVMRLDRELNYSSNGTVLEGNKSDLEEIRWIHKEDVCIWDANQWANHSYGKSWIRDQK
jgi:hypothetical protein